ncbi:TetR/AcrR family transcriptional regulator C-terminal domain-containing protein [Clostridium sp. Marseille-P2415]|uniref:TetR/AcrR family transcriptional regulator C-terminal domain-containing protein n=1 Tax=Clostridium sp. Marseille-P2415 TaxID=1805471 RepID=UPI00098877AE|nr:TetR/AcrR family transcriptional regulator C-terminal domain-containing protein [Clostridium sp. Marseille-P2415]
MNTKEILITGMFNLMKEQSFDNITIQMILNECNVSRSTFYRYYRDKYDIMNDCYQYEADGLLKMVDSIGWEAVLTKIFSFEKENLSFFYQASKIDGKNSFWDFLYDYSYKFYSRNLDLSDEYNKIALTQTIAGEIQVVKDWIETGCQIEPAVLAGYLIKLTPDGFY